MREIGAEIVLNIGTAGSPEAVPLSRYSSVTSCLQLRADNEAN